MNKYFKILILLATLSMGAIVFGQSEMMLMASRAQYKAANPPPSSNLILNGTFDSNDASNVDTDFGWRIDNNQAEYWNNSLVAIDFTLSSPMVDGTTYTLTMDITSAGTTPRFKIATIDSDGAAHDIVSYTNYTTGAFTLDITPNTGSAFSLDKLQIMASGGGDYFEIDNVSLIEQ